VRTFLIADLRGYTRFTVEHGDEAAARLASTFAGLARAAAAAHGGEVIEIRGDEALAVFSSARQALRAALDLQARCVATERADPSLPLRAGVGIDAGEAVRVEAGYRGAALNLAARLCSLAGAREVLTSEGVIHLARRTEGMVYAERGLVELKGFAEPVRVIQVLSETETYEDEPGSSEVQTASQPAPSIGGFLGALPPGPLIGRDDEIGHVISAVDAVEAGNGQLVMLIGEAGIGRTRLAQEITVLARDRGFLIATGRCYRSEQGTTFFPFLEAVGMVYRSAPATVRAGLARQWPALGRQLQGERGAPVTMEAEEQEDGQRVLRAVGGFLAAVAEQAPVALLVDDLQWADESSLRLLQHLARQSRTQRILLVGTYNEAALERDSALDTVLRELGRERLVERLTLRRLTPEGTGAMVSASVGDMEATHEFADFVHRRTKGNPYFIDEMLRAVAGRYRLLRLVGAGGMGCVFQAVDSKSGKVVAAKILFASSEADLDALLRFQQEGAVLSTLKHPNIVEVYGTFLEEHTSCIIMELLEGRSLRQVLQQERLDLARIKTIARETAAALAYAHTRSIVHRDVKPDNIMVMPGDRVKVTDFGIARILRPGGSLHTMTAMTLGTPLYMAPEQIEGRPVDGRADIYSLGAVLYEALAGRPPFESDDPMTLAYRQVNDTPEPPSQVNPDVPADWEAVILKALAKDPEERYTNAVTFERAIAELSVNTSTRETALVTAKATSRRPSISRPTSGAIREDMAATGHVSSATASQPRVQPAGRSRSRSLPRLRSAVLRPRRSLLALPGVAGIAATAIIIAQALSPAPAVTVMGQPVAGWAVHTSASPLNFPQGVAIDAGGTVYVADHFNNRIARLSADGTPLAPWGSKTGVQLNYPEGVAVDAAGNLYVADTGNNRIQKLSPDGAPLDQWTTSGSVQFRSPQGIAVGHDGLIYVADTGNGRVAVLTSQGSPVANWTASSLAGGPANAVALAVDRQGSVYVVDQASNVVEKFTSRGKLQLQIGTPGRGAGSLSGPSAVVVDSAGNVFVADTANRRIQRFSSTGAVTLWQGAALQFSHPSALALDGTGNLYVADAAENVIRKVSGAGRRLADWRGELPHGSLLTNPSGVAADAAGNIYIADTGHDRILEVAPNGRLLAANGMRGPGSGQFEGPIGVAVSASNSVYVADTNNNRIQKVPPGGGASSPRSARFAGMQLIAPWGVAVDSGGKLYVTDTGDNKVQVASPSGAPALEWGTSGSGKSQFASPEGIAVSRTGSIYVADTGNNRIEAFDSAGHFLFTWGGPGAASFSSPSGVAVDDNGNVYVADSGNNRVQELTAKGRVVATVKVAGSKAGTPEAPSAVAVDGAGNVYVTTNTDRAVKIAPR